MACDVLAVDGIHYVLRRDPRAQRRLVARRRRRDRDTDRGQRRRQVDDPALDQRPQPSPAGLDHVSRGGHHERLAPPDRQGRDRSEPRRTAPVPPDVRDREPRDGRLPAHGPRELQRRHGPGVRAVPAAARASPPEGRDDVRRRAADVRDRPCADGAPDIAAPRRAVDGARSDLRREDLRDRRSRSTSRARRSCSSSRTR